MDKTNGSDQIAGQRAVIVSFTQPGKSECQAKLMLACAIGGSAPEAKWTDEHRHLLVIRGHPKFSARGVVCPGCSP